MQVVSEVSVFRKQETENRKQNKLAPFPVLIYSIFFSYGAAVVSILL